MSAFDRREHPDPYAAQGFVDVVRDISYFDEHVYAYHDHQSELELSPWRDGEWVPAAHLIHLFGDNAAALLARWGGADDGSQVLLLTRARAVETRNKSGELISKVSGALHSYFWNGDALFSDCAAGVFDREFQGLLMRAVGVELRKDDLERLVGRPLPSEPLALQDSSDDMPAADGQPTPASVSAAPQVPTVRLATKGQSEQWYRDRKQEADRLGVRYTRDQDEAAGKEVGIGRDRVRELRNNIAPAWAARDGRPPKGGR